MPQLLESIDRIARVKRRDVLCVVFRNPEKIVQKQMRDRFANNDWVSRNPGKKMRAQVLEWLSENGVPYVECFDFWSDGLIQDTYNGTVYLDIPYDLSDPNYMRLQNYFENADGAMKIPGVVLSLLTLDLALKNAHHDKEGYWDESGVG